MELSLTEGIGASRAKQVVRRVFRDYPGSLAVRLWNGETQEIGEGPPDFTLIFHDARPFRELILFRDPLRLAEAYFQGSVDVEGDLYGALGLKDHLQSLALTVSEKAAFLKAALLLADGPGTKTAAETTARWSGPLHTRFSRRHSRNANRKAIAFHYDVSNDFYGLWLDERMVYSCAYFEDPGQDLEQAQRNKLTHICRKLRLRPGERLLDIGCGWGALICWAAEHYGVRAHGVTLSRNQYEYGLRQIREQGLEGRVTIELGDYRDLKGEAVFDKIASVGMFEHVGLKNLPLYFGTAHRLLKSGGLFLNHGITHDGEGWHRTVSTEFINRYVFPDGELDSVGNIQRAMERSRFEILDVEALRPHYALTLRHWVRRLEARREEALRHVTEAVYRVWRLYMAACALQFEEGGIGVYQILASKRGKGPSPVPLTRRDLYRE
jgi:cyclopropane-fatty-acyl-phospholipid synthase